MSDTIKRSRALRAFVSLAAGALLMPFHACSAPADRTPPDGVTTAPGGSLRSIMQGMEAATSQIASGIWAEDYDHVGSGAAAIADHPPIPEVERLAIREQLADDFTAFAQLDQHVHQGAVELNRLAEERAPIGDVLASYERLQAGCVGCHTLFRERVASLATAAK